MEGACKYLPPRPTWSGENCLAEKRYLMLKNKYVLEYMLHQEHDVFINCIDSSYSMIEQKVQNIMMEKLLKRNSKIYGK